MTKEEAVLGAYLELGLDTSPGDVKAWAKKHGVDVDNTLIARLKQEAKQKLQAPPTPPPAPLDVEAVAVALEVARRLVGVCGNKEAAKRLIDAA